MNPFCGRRFYESDLSIFPVNWWLISASINSKVIRIFHVGQHIDRKIGNAKSMSEIVHWLFVWIWKRDDFDAGLFLFWCKTNEFLPLGKWISVTLQPRWLHNASISKILFCSHVIVDARIHEKIAPSNIVLQSLSIFSYLT